MTEQKSISFMTFSWVFPFVFLVLKHSIGYNLYKYNAKKYHKTKKLDIWKQLFAIKKFNPCEREREKKKLLKDKHH